MPRSGGGVYSLPAGSIVADGVDDILAAQHNDPLNDLALDMNTARPIVAGGTGATTASGARTALGLAVGTDVQAFDTGLASIAGLTTAADRMIYTTASDVYAVAPLTAAGRAILDDADAAAQLVTLGAQPVDADLTAIAGLSGTGIAVRTAANTWANRQVVSSDGSVTITNPAGIAGDIGLLGATLKFSDTTSAGPGTTVDFPGLAGWEAIEIDILTTKANTGQLFLRVSFDNGSSYQTSGYAGGTSDLGSDSTTTSGLLLARDTPSMTFRASVRLAKMTTQAWLTGGNYGSTSFETMHSLAPAGTVNAIRLFSSGGNLTNTTIQVTGVRRA